MVMRRLLQVSRKLLQPRKEAVFRASLSWSSVMHGKSRSRQNVFSDLLDIEGEEKESREVTSGYQDLVNRYFHVATSGHQVLVVQPHCQKRHDRRRQNKPDSDQTRPLLMLDESVSLVKTLEWKVVDTMLISVPSLQRKNLLSYHQMQKLQEKVRTEQKITAVFISVYNLRPTQRIQIEAELQVPVIDRYSLVLEIFYQHARSPESRLQVALAEIPYLKMRLHSDHTLELNSKNDSGRLGEKEFEAREKAINQLEAKIKTKIGRMKEQRERLRLGRSKQEVPVVAVVGYTNSGKTTLIKALSGSSSLEPKDQLFATLDVTCHSVRLPSNLNAVFLDTVGFISDIPTELIASFSSTLEDALQADLLLHIRDVSHPDTCHQDMQVRQTLTKLRTFSDAAKGKPVNVLSVANKIDRLSDVDEVRGLVEAGNLPISALHSVGLDRLLTKVEEEIVEATNRRRLVIRVRSGSDEEEWLRSRAAVSDAVAVESDQNFVDLSIIITEANFAKFKSYFVRT